MAPFVAPLFNCWIFDTSLLAPSFLPRCTSATTFYVPRYGCSSEPRLGCLSRRHVPNRDNALACRYPLGPLSPVFVFSVSAGRETDGEDVGRLWITSRTHRIYLIMSPLSSKITTGSVPEAIHPGQNHIRRRTSNDGARHYLASPCLVSLAYLAAIGP